MKRFIKQIVKVIFFIPNLVGDAVTDFFDFAHRQHLFFKIIAGYILALMAGGVIFFPLGGCLYLIDLIFNSNILDTFGEFFLAKYMYIKLPLLGLVALFWLWRDHRNK
jgi:hypothetical protein